MQQEYWRGDIWGPVNYILWVGIKKYAAPGQIEEYADRNVRLFMHDWQAEGICSENYLSTDGSHNHDPHYTWGALLNLVALESIIDVDDSGQIVLNGTLNKTLTLSHIPLLGKTFDVKVTPGSAELLRDGRWFSPPRGKSSTPLCPEKTYASSPSNPSCRPWLHQRRLPASLRTAHPRPIGQSAAGWPCHHGWRHAGGVARRFAPRVSPRRRAARLAFAQYLPG